MSVDRRMLTRVMVTKKSRRTYLVSRQLDTLVKYVKETMKLNQWYAGVFILCDFLNFVNVVGQMFFINKFLGGVFMNYGTEVLHWSDMEAEDRTDPLIEVFPR